MIGLYFFENNNGKSFTINLGRLFWLPIEETTWASCGLSNRFPQVTKQERIWFPCKRNFPAVKSRIFMMSIGDFFMGLWVRFCPLNAKKWLKVTSNGSKIAKKSESRLFKYTVFYILIHIMPSLKFYNKSGISWKKLYFKNILFTLILETAKCIILYFYLALSSMYSIYICMYIMNVWSTHTCCMLLTVLIHTNKMSSRNITFLSQFKLSLFDFIKNALMLLIHIFSTLFLFEFKLHIVCHFSCWYAFVE